MERQVSNNNLNMDNREQNPLERFAGAEMADRGPKSVSGFTNEEDSETRPVTNMFAEPGDDDDMDDEDDDDIDLDDDDFDDDEVVGDDDVVADDDVVVDEDLNDDDLLLEDDEDDEEDDL